MDATAVGADILGVLERELPTEESGDIAVT